jgi:hypothetical protein
MTVQVMTSKLNLSTMSRVYPLKADLQAESSDFASGPRLCEKSHRCYDSSCESAGGG